MRYLPCTDWIGYSDRAPDPDHSLRYPHNPTIFPIPEACKESHGQVKGNAEAGVPATNGARCGAVSNSVCSDNEIWLRHPTAHRRTSGYISTEDTVLNEIEYHCSTHRGQLDRETAQQRSIEDLALKSPADFIVPPTVYGQPAKTLSNDRTFTVTQNQLMDIVRRACHEVTLTPSSVIPVQPKQLSYSSPHIDADGEPQSAAYDQVESNESRVRGRPTTSRHFIEPPPARARVRWRSPSVKSVREGKLGYLILQCFRI